MLSTEQALTVVAVVTFASLAVAWARLRIWQANETITAALDDGWVYDGPDSLRLLEDLDEHLDSHFARLAPLFEEVGPPEEEGQP